jgi:hypothetical protein
MLRTEAAKTLTPGLRSSPTIRRQTPRGFTRAGKTPGPSGRTHETLETAPSCWNAPPEADGPDALRFGEPGEHHSPRPTLPWTERIG